MNTTVRVLALLLFVWMLWSIVLLNRKVSVLNSSIDNSIDWLISQIDSKIGSINARAVADERDRAAIQRLCAELYKREAVIERLRDQEICNFN